MMGYCTSCGKDREISCVASLCDPCSKKLKAPTINADELVERLQKRKLNLKVMADAYERGLDRGMDRAIEIIQEMAVESK